MMRASQTSAEEFFSRRMADAQVLLDAARWHAGEGDAVGALATTLASDVATVQALLWERVNVAPRAPSRQFFQAAEALSTVMSGFGAQSEASLVSVVQSARRTMSGALDDSLAADCALRWPDLGFLGALPAPTTGVLDASLQLRTGGLSVPEFIAVRREAAGRLMLEAQASRVRGAISEAIGLSYDSDFVALEAYLAESAWVAGDRWLLTAIARWDLVTRSVSELAGLPDGFSDAAIAVRSVMTRALGDNDGARLDEAFAAI